MRRPDSTGAHRRQVLPSVAAVVALGAVVLAFTAPSGAEGSVVAGGAFGHQVSVSLDGQEPMTSGRFPP